MKTNNKTLREIHSNSERYVLITWMILVLIFSLVGDSIILVATTKYRAIKLNKVIVAVIQHLAVSDLFLAVFSVLPTVLALISDDWVIGMFLGHVHVHVHNLCTAAGFFLCSMMATLKLIVLKYPLRCACWSTRLGHMIGAVLWVLSLSIYIPWIVMTVIYLNDDLYFDYTVYQCSYSVLSSTRTPRWFKRYRFTTICLGYLLPCIVIPIASVLILVVAKKAADRHREALRWEGAATVLVTMGVSFISFLPYFATFIIDRDNHAMLRATFFLTFLNIMANFFVYSQTVKSFRNFQKRKVSQLFYTLFPSTHRTHPLGKVQTSTMSL